MGQFPETRVSLILRLAQPEDVEAWDEFASVYVPALFGLATRKGLSRADAEDITQEIMMAVARSVGRWQPDAGRAKFRTWLCTIARNTIANFFEQRKNFPGVQLSDSLLDRVPANDSVPIGDCEFDSEYHKAVYRLATQRVRARVAASSWDAFVSTTLEQVPIEEVAARLRMRLGNVYVARCRVLRLLREEAQRIDAGLSGEWSGKEYSSKLETQS